MEIFLVSPTDPCKAWVIVSYSSKIDVFIMCHTGVLVRLIYDFFFSPLFESPRGFQKFCPPASRHLAARDNLSSGMGSSITAISS